MEHVFFKPWVGRNYENGGIFSKKLLVLGESHYCGGCNQCGLKYGRECEEFTKDTVINYLNGEEEAEFDIYKAVTLSAVGILGWYSVLTGKEFRVPDFRNPEDRDKIRWDTRKPFAKNYKELTLPCKLEERDKFDLYDPKYKFGL